MTLEPALNAYGYPLLYLGTILEGETFVIISAILCQTGHLKVVWVVCAAFFGALSGDLFCFQMGRIGGGKLLKKESRWQWRADKASRLLKQHQTLVVFSYRFLYGLRAVIPFLIGATGYSFRRFILLSSAGALIWSITVTAAGLVFGKILLPIISDLTTYRIWVIGGFLTFGILCWAIYHFKHRHSD
jgi:membrane protein DedA with SNARE-associated domain